MKPIINILESGKILLDCLNRNEDFVEVDTKDVVFLRLIGDETVQFLDMAFLLEKNSVFVDALQSNEFFSVTELDNDKFLCQLNEKKVDLDWIFLGNIRNYKNLPDNTDPYFICIQDTECQTFYINLDKVSFVKTHTTDYETINITFHHSENNKMVFYKSVSNSKYIRFFDAIESYNHALNRENDFYLFFEWFKDRQNLENEQILSTSNFNYRDNQLNCVRETIYKFLPHISDIFFTNKTKIMTLKENGNNLSINQLSYGIKMLLVLIGDITRRLVMINSNRFNPLDGDGVVLIDEIELYLNHKYQSQIVSKLTELFPNIQFIITTNSSDLLIKQGKEIIL